MDLADAASFFDDEGFIDAYEPYGVSFLGQTDVYDGSKRDGSTIVRKVLSVVPGTEIPSRGALRSSDTNVSYIVGLRIPDAFQGETIREKYILQVAEDLAVIRSASEVLSAAKGVSARAGILWVKNAKDERTSSESFPIYRIYFNLSETITKKNILSFNNKLYRVRVVTTPPSQFLIAECYELDTLVEDTTYTPGSTDKDIPSDTYPAAIPLTVNGLRERYKSYYDNQDAGAVKYVPGDEVVSILKTDVVSPELQDRINFADLVVWSVVDVYDPGDGTWALHTRRL